jgi:hypothetical protein
MRTITTAGIYSTHLVAACVPANAAEANGFSLGRLQPRTERYRCFHDLIGSVNILSVPTEFPTEFRGDGATTEYFGIVLELLQIDGSKPAVNLRVVASPNKWSRSSQRAAVTDDPSGKYVQYQQFFQRLIDDLRERRRFTNARAGQPQNWYSFSSGTSGFQYGASFAAGGRLRAEVYIDRGERGQNVAALEALRADRSTLEREFGEPLERELLEGKRACRVAVYRPGTIADSADSLETYHRWLVDRLLRFKSVIGPRLPAIAARAGESRGQSVLITTDPANQVFFLLRGQRKGTVPLPFRSRMITSRVIANRLIMSYLGKAVATGLE